MNKALYAERDPRQLEPYFSQHMMAMTAEGLHMKAAIAEELAHRDKRIADLEAILKIDEPHPFPDGFDALDLAVEQNKAYIARIEAQDAQIKRLSDGLTEIRDSTMRDAVRLRAMAARLLEDGE